MEVVLKDEGYTPVSACSAAEALKLLERLSVDGDLLRKCQLEDKIILADRIFNDAVSGVDIRPLVAKARLEKELPVDPVEEYVRGGYQERIEPKRG